MVTTIERNYKSIVDRGLITPITNHDDFLRKIYEEVNELKNAYSQENLEEEMADVILVVFNYARHYNINIWKAIHDKIKINEIRANGKSMES